MSGLLALTGLSLMLLGAVIGADPVLAWHLQERRVKIRLLIAALVFTLGVILGFVGCFYDFADRLGR